MIGVTQHATPGVALQDGLSRDGEAHIPAGRGAPAAPAARRRAEAPARRDRGLPMSSRARPFPRDSARDNTSADRSFPGWRWVLVAVAFPVAGYIGWKVSGHVDAVDAALVGGALTGAGIGAVEWWAANGALGRSAAWIGASAIGYAVGLAAGAALVGYDTDLGALALMGLLSGAALGAAQGLVLARQGRRTVALPWAAAMPLLFALGWSVASVTGIGVDDQFTVFGAGGAIVFMLLSGLLLARFTPARTAV
jgi:hypothetical protein